MRIAGTAHRPDRVLIGHDEEDVRPLAFGGRRRKRSQHKGDDGDRCDTIYEAFSTAI
jgi:hypothetical protein